METKDDVLKALLAPIVEELVTNAMSTYFTVNGFDAIVERVVQNMRKKEEADNAAMGQAALQQQMQRKREMMELEKLHQERYFRKYIEEKTVAPWETESKKWSKIK